MTDAQALTAALNGKWHGAYGTACCPAHSDSTPSLSLCNGIDGRLLLKCHTGCTFTDVLDALKCGGLVDGGDGFPRMDPLALAAKQKLAEADAERKAKQALSVWKETLPIAGSLAETYLRGRGITCDLAATLRFHPSCWHMSAQRLPAMVALIDGGKHFAIHRTYLDPNGNGKAKAAPSKAMLGLSKGGAVRLSNGDGPLVVAEGIETTLSLSSGLLDGPATVWAALSTSGMKSLHLPAKPSQLTIATDGEQAGQEAGYTLAGRASALGWKVSMLPAPAGRDWNDILMMKGGNE